MLKFVVEVTNGVHVLRIVYKLKSIKKKGCKEGREP
jgi:hypothetical protein